MSVKRPHDTARWRNHVRPALLKRNPVCQRLDDDMRQCDKPATIIHHAIDWRDRPDLAYDWSNLVTLCADHHPGGKPGDVFAICHTIGWGGEIVREGITYPAWDARYVKPEQMTERDRLRLMIAQGTHSVSNTDIDRALA